MLYYMHLKVLYSVRKKKKKKYTPLCGIALLIVRQSMFEFQFLLQIFGIKQIVVLFVH